MSKRRNNEILSDILEAIRRIHDYTSGMDYQNFLKDLKTRDAVIRNLEIIGEASKSVPDEFKKQFQEIPWKEMCGVRDKLIHHYFGVNFEIVWSIISEELPEVRKNINNILNKIGNES